jgi:4-amino-4-deoxy-L-arabinose transferase-like glycosyltransferase
MTTVVSAPAAPAPAAAAGRPRFELPALAVLLVGTGALHLGDLGASGWANSFYAAAVQAGSQDWTAFFFGSLDPAGAITVDKPPAALWVMALSARIFGFSPWSMLAPQALMAVAAVALLRATVRRVVGPAAGLLAGAALALTPVAVLMFRFNNPDALLVLLLVAAAWATTRAVETASTRWLLLAGVFLGFGFLTKMLQAFLVVPGLALAYLWAAPTTLGRRIGQLLAGGLAVVVSAGWWLLLVALWPAASRPYIGGSTDNSPLELALGYNGLARVLGGGPGGGRPPGGVPELPDGFDGPPPGGPGGRVAGFGGEAGPLRLFNAEIGGQVAWLLPAALILLVAGLWLTRRAGRSPEGRARDTGSAPTWTARGTGLVHPVDAVRAALLLWGGWTIVTALVFSLMGGVFHAYYTVALAPGVAALVAIGGREAWRGGDRSGHDASTSRSVRDGRPGPDRASRTGRGVLASTTAVTAVWAWVLLGRSAAFLPSLRWTVLAVGAVAAVALLLPAARWGGFGARAAAVALGAALLSGLAGPAAYAAQTAVTPHQGSIPTAGPGTVVVGGPGFPGPRGVGSPVEVVPGGAGPGGAGPGDSPGGPGDGPVGPALAALLTSADTRWAAATIGSQGASSMMLATGTSVMAIGGFMGADPYPTTAQFQQYVADGEIRWFVEGGGGGPLRGDHAITMWVRQHYAAQTVDGRTVYDLAAPRG